MPAAKRKTDASAPATAKKAKAAHTAAIETVKNILNDPSNFDTPDKPVEVRRALVELAEYARSLEEEVTSLKPKQKSAKEVEDAADKLATAARSGIRKQMTWKPSCKTGSAKWLYDGVCSDPAVFGAFLGLDGPPTFKQKKFPKDAFEDLVGDLRVPIRYDTLFLTSDVNVRWNPEEGTFKCSGSYGKSQL